ncbi:uncharacterized protein LOC131170274, partial [Hevea brasiliensis]|uniref:uncharacterized protein LOC131170274 n=1 Tax=Hevea brasiliensis TaxID=3981 RepID=UPI0025E39121
MDVSVFMRNRCEAKYTDAPLPVVNNAAEGGYVEDSDKDNDEDREKESDESNENCLTTLLVPRRLGSMALASQVTLLNSRMSLLVNHSSRLLQPSRRSKLKNLAIQHPHSKIFGFMDILGRVTLSQVSEYSDQVPCSYLDQSPVCWDEVGERRLTRPELIQLTSEKVRLIRDRLLTAQSRQRSYADPKRKDVEFMIGDHVFLRVSPMKGIMRFGKKGKLSPRFVGPFEILERIGAVAYRLALSPGFAHVHPVFHISMLRKYVPDPSHILQPQTMQIRNDMSYEEQPVKILDRQIRKLQSKEVALIKVLWHNHSSSEATWEAESEMRAKYPHLFD